jgi:F-type H+-transporting ATPase subunit a
MEHPILFINVILEAIGLPVPHTVTGHGILEQVCTPYMTYTWLVMALLILVALLVKRNIKTVPTGLQNFLEPVIDSIENMIEETMGPKGKAYFPLIATIAFFILVSNLIALIPGFFPPTANLNTNAAMALTVFAMTHIDGLKEHGIGYFKHFCGPVIWLAPLIVPIEIVGHLARPLSLTLRLFGNVYGHEIVLMIFFGLVPFIVPLPMMLMGVLVAFIQTFVFMLLAMIYIAGSLEEAH